MHLTKKGDTQLHGIIYVNNISSQRESICHYHFQPQSECLCKDKELVQEAIVDKKPKLCRLFLYPKSQSMPIIFVS